MGRRETRAILVGAGSAGRCLPASDWIRTQASVSVQDKEFKSPECRMLLERLTEAVGHEVTADEVRQVLKILNPFHADQHLTATPDDIAEACTLILPRISSHFRAFLVSLGKAKPILEPKKIGLAVEGADAHMFMENVQERESEAL